MIIIITCMYFKPLHVISSASQATVAVQAASATIQKMVTRRSATAMFANREYRDDRTCLLTRDIDTKVAMLDTYNNKKGTTSEQLEDLRNVHSFNQIVQKIVAFRKQH